MKMSHVAVGVLAAAAIVVGVVSVRGGGLATSGVAASAVASPTGPVLVTYTDKGFVPSVIKVARGTSIRFMNTGGKALRLAPRTDSAFNTIANTELTASKSVKIGESFQVSITKPGVWGYVNLNNQGDIGVVIVE